MNNAGHGEVKNREAVALLLFLRVPRSFGQYGNCYYYLVLQQVGTDPLRFRRFGLAEVARVDAVVFPDHAAKLELT